MSTNKLKIYGIAPSQPCRAVMFLCAMKDIPYELIKVSPAKRDAVREEYEDSINPSGKVPGLQDTDGFMLYESPAIMTYIASKYQCDDLYPSATTDMRRRAMIDQYLHWHHENTRRITGGYLMLLLRPDIPMEKFSASTLRKTRKLANVALDIIENQWLSRHEFIVDDRVSLADILCYEEVMQIVRWKLIDNASTRYPNIVAWCERMEKLPGYDASHRILSKLDVFIAKRLKQCEPLLAKL